MIKVLSHIIIALLLMVPTTNAEESNMSKATGTFEISMIPQDDGAANMGRFQFEKAFAGDITGTSIGQMLSHRSSVEGSAGYVAMEKLTITVDGKTGSFHAQHTGTMQAGDQSASISIVPDSGTDQLTGISGSMVIEVVDGQHFYTLTYSLN